MDKQYKTVYEGGEGEIVEKKSRFIATVIPCEDEETALKFIEADFLTDRLMKRPVVLLDDVFSELDAVRQKCLVKNFKDNQVIITSVEAVD